MNSELDIVQLEKELETAQKRITQLDNALFILSHSNNNYMHGLRDLRRERDEARADALRFGRIAIACAAVAIIEEIVIIFLK